jgi:hypothetical protein
MGASGRKVGHHYQPQQRNSVVLVTITTFHACCSGAGGARARSYERVKGGVGRECTMGASVRMIRRHYQPQQENLVVLVTITTFHARCSGAGGARDRSYEWVKGGVRREGNMGASVRMIRRHYQPQQRNFVVLVTITTFHACCSGAGGARDRSYERVKGGVRREGTMGASVRMIRRHYQPQQRNFVVLVTITTFHTCCSGAEGTRDRSYERVKGGV